MSPDSVWVVGATRSGKTTRLIHYFCNQDDPTSGSLHPEIPRSVLVFAATGDDRITLADRLAYTSQGNVPFDSATPLGFFQDEILLFWPLLAPILNLRVQFPLRLRPETEQELATHLWRSLLDTEQLAQPGVPEYYMVRRTLDLMQLAATAGIPVEDIPAILRDGLGMQEDTPQLWDVMGQALLDWRQWCLERGLLTYGIILELYWRYLLPDVSYQQHLLQRYCSVFADDVDEYPAIAHSLFTLFLDQEIPCCFTYNPNGAIRLGLGADPQALSTLADRCSIQHVELAPEHTLGFSWATPLANWLDQPLTLPDLPETMQTIQTVSRVQLLQETANRIAGAIHRGEASPGEVAVIGPGLDAIARYTLREILSNQGIPVESLSDQQPLVSSPLVRALLSLLAFIYPGAGRLLDRESVAEMLVVLSQPATTGAEGSGLDLAQIDPVRAGLITDHCFAPHPDYPKLLPVTHFPRWDRLGYRATSAYTDILQWIETQHTQHQQRLIATPLTLLDRAIQRFFFGGSHLPYDQLAALRELLETAQHYWEVDRRLRQGTTLNRLEPSPTNALEQFIQLLRNGTITADPYPVRPLGLGNQAVTLATIFQYRSSRRVHRWQFWLDASSPLWLTGGGALFGAPLFLREWSGRPWTAADTLAADQQRLKRQLLDLLYRVEERVYLCHSDLATNGQEQGGPLLGVVNAALPWDDPVALTL